MKSSPIQSPLRRFAFLAVLASMLFCISLPSAIADSPAKPYQRQKDVVVAESPHGVVIPMDVFTPTKDANGIGIIDVASGAWSSDRGKIRDHEMAQVYNIFCARGYTLFAIRPGSSSRFSAHDMVKHLETAIGEIQKNSEHWKIDPDRLSITGASAGGHLASLVAVRGKVKLVGAGVFFPPTDFLAYGEDSAGIDSAIVKRFARTLAYPDRLKTLDEQETREQLMKISPAHLVTADAPPFLLIHGDADKVVPLQQSKRLLGELQSKNVSAELIIKEGGGHPWLTIPEEVAKMADWFDKLYAATPVAATN